MSWLDTKYINLLSSRLERFRQKSPSLYSFRCSVCGDSQKNKYKTRGYIYEKENNFYVCCHNCGYGASFKTFLKRTDARLYSEYQLESLRLTAPEQADNIEQKKQFNTTRAFERFCKYPTISSIPLSDPYNYLKSRKIPEHLFDEFRWAPKFMEFTNAVIPDKFSDDALVHDEGRIVFPYFDRDGRFFAFQGRSISTDALRLRYISINLDESQAMLWGLDRVSFDSDIFIFEGLLDGVFLKNGIGLAGSNYGSLTKYLPHNRIVCCFDNEPHSKTTVKKINSVIDQGFRVVILPSTVVEKDVNEMIVNGMTQDEVQNLFSSNIYDGLKAKVRLNSWSNV